MTTDLDIYRSASVLIREHGERAALERGDPGGAGTWRRVLKAVEELQRVEPAEREWRH